MSTEARVMSKQRTQVQQSQHEEALARLAVDGWIERRNETSWKTSRRWQQAMARTAARLYKEDPGDDLRVPIAHVMVEIYDGSVDDEALVELVEAMLPIEAAALGLVT
jgi:hypothetical protein